MNIICLLIKLAATKSLCLPKMILLSPLSLLSTTTAFSLLYFLQISIKFETLIGLDSPIVILLFNENAWVIISG